MAKRSLTEWPSPSTDLSIYLEFCELHTAIMDWYPTLCLATASQRPDCGSTPPMMRAIFAEIHLSSAASSAAKLSRNTNFIDGADFAVSKNRAPSTFYAGSLCHFGFAECGLLSG